MSRKRLLALVLSFVMVQAMCLPVSAAEREREASIREFQESKIQSMSIDSSLQGASFLAVSEDGTLWGWGMVNDGVLGNGGAYDGVDDTDSEAHYRDYPEKLMENVAWAEIGYYTLAIQKDGTVWYSGVKMPDSGERNETFEKLTDHGVAVSVLRNWYLYETYYDSDTEILVVKDNGELWAYQCESLNRGTMDGKKLMDGVKDVSCGSNHALVLKNDGSVWAWGSWEWGQLGDGQYNPDADRMDADGNKQTAEPVKVMDGVVSIWAQGNRSFAIKEDGSLWYWGQFQREYAHMAITEPAKLTDQVVRFTDYSGLSYVKEDGNLWTWNSNLASAEKNEGFTNMKQVADEGTTDYYIDQEGRLWGEGYFDPNNCFFVPRGNAENVDWEKKVKVQMAGSAPETEKPTAPQFTDVAPTSPYATAIEWAVEQNITKGTTDTTFSPTNPCSKAQILTFLYRAVGSPEPTISNPFSDIAENNYFYNAAIWAYEKGMVSGSEFNSGTPCTRSQTVKYLWQFAGSPSVSTTTAFTDVAADADYATAVAWAVENEVTKGTSATTFAPDTVCNRGQIVTFLYRSIV